jgi:hypothetical protein
MRQILSASFSNLYFQQDLWDWWLFVIYAISFCTEKLYDLLHLENPTEVQCLLLTCYKLIWQSQITRHIYLQYSEWGTIYSVCNFLAHAVYNQTYPRTGRCSASFLVKTSLYQQLACRGRSPTLGKWSHVWPKVQCRRSRSTRNRMNQGYR